MKPLREMTKYELMMEMQVLDYLLKQPKEPGSLSNSAREVADQKTYEIEVLLAQIEFNERMYDDL